MATNKNIFVTWATWHFGEMPRVLVFVWKNYVLFVLYFFSVPLLLKTLFSPWKKAAWRYPKGFDIGGYASTFVSNIFSRIIGAICRLGLIIAGIISLLITLLAGAVMIVFWILIPFIFLGLLFLFINS